MEHNFTNLRTLLRTIQGETKPIDDHPDPGALTDCWEEAFEMLETISTPSTKRYKILTASNQGELEELVCQAMDEGWEPYGSMSVIFWENPDYTEIGRGWEYNQPVVRYQKKEK